jgi:Domain of unknown function (DUF4145)
MSKAPVAPSVTGKRFSCPHCGAYADQFWASLYAKSIKDHGIPWKVSVEDVEENAEMAAKNNAPLEPEMINNWRETAQRVAAGEVFYETGEDHYLKTQVNNLWVSECFSCRRLAVWVHERLLYPTSPTGGVEANEDMPPEIMRDFNEAREIAVASPRGAAALLRLCIQKLCVHFGEPGKDLNTDIGSLVKKGLDVRIQRALDVVRVIGNEAVHPGSLDLKDDRDTANELFKVVNLIVERMITQEKHVAEMYSTLPPAKLKAIEDRDKKKP